MRTLAAIGLVALLLVALGLFYISNYLGHAERSVSQWHIQKNNAHCFYYKGAKISFTETGNGTPVLLIHGGGSWGYSFRENIDSLSDSLTVYTIDIPGHGYSDVPIDWTFNLTNINDLLIEFLKFIHTEKIGLVGNSWGGGWAINFAENYPEKVTALVLIDSSGLKDSNNYDQSAWRYLSSPIGNLVLSFVTKSEIAKDYQHKLFFDGTKLDDMVIEEVANTFLYRDNLYAQKSYQRNLDWLITDQYLNQLKNVTIIWGRQDAYLPLTMAYEYQQRIPGARLYVVDDTSHLPHEEKPEIVNQILIDSLKHNQ